MRKFIFLLSFIFLIYSPGVFSEEIEIRSSVISIDLEGDFLIIRNGVDKSIEIGDGLIVYRDGEKIAEAYIIEVRPTVSAAEVLSIEENKEIREGDSILIVKKVGEIEKPAYITKPSIVEEGDTVAVNIKGNPHTVFAYANLVLKEEGFIITSSNRMEGILLASKPTRLSIIKELWADATSAIDHNLVVSLDIKGVGNSSTLKAFAFREHSQKQKYIKRAVKKNSKYYNDLVEVISKIKKRSEY